MTKLERRVSLCWAILATETTHARRQLFRSGHRCDLRGHRAV